MCCADGTCARCVRAHLDKVWAGIRMREIKKSLRTEYRPDRAVALRAELKAQTGIAQGRLIEVSIAQDEIENLLGLADIGR